MRRIALPSGVILPALLAALPACGKDPPPAPPCAQLECGDACVDPMTDSQNCGRCGLVCGEGACVAGTCTAGCDAPNEVCGVLCVDTDTSSAHCGSCDHDCGAGVACVAGECAAPLALIQTSYLDGELARDLHVLQDLTFATVKLNATTFDDDRVSDHALLPDGRLVVVAAETEGVSELWLAAPRPGTLTRLNGPLVAGGNVLPGFVVSKDGTRVLYRADQDVDGKVELYAVSLAQPGASVRINGDLDGGGSVSRVFALSADGKRAAFLADLNADDTREAYTVDLTGAMPGPPRVIGPAGVEMWDLRLTPAGDRVVVRAYDPRTGRLALHVAATANPSSATEIVYADGAEGQVEGYALAPDGSAVVFTGGNRFLRASLWHMPLPLVGAATRLVDGDTGGVRADLLPSRDGAQVYYRAIDTSGFDRIFRVAVATPGAVTPISPHADDASGEATDFTLSADERALVYRGGADGAEGGIPRPETDDTAFVREHAPALRYIDLSVSPPPAPAELGLPVDAKGEEGIATGYRVTADGRRVIYRADHDTPGTTEAYLVSVTAPGTVRKVSPPLDGASDATDVARVALFP